MNGGVPGGNFLKSTEEIETLTPARLEQELILGRQAILQGMLDYYHFMRERYPNNIIDPFVPVGIMKLGKMDNVLTPQGMDNNTSLHYDKFEITTEFRDYFDAIARAAFRPFVRSRLGYDKKYDGTLLSMTTEDPIE